MMHSTDSESGSPIFFNQQLTPGIAAPDDYFFYKNYGTIGSINNDLAKIDSSRFLPPSTIYYYKLKKQAWRFAKVMEYIFIHSAVFTGTTIGYSTICASFVTYIENSEKTDMEIFEMVYWVTLIASIFVGLADTVSYLTYLYKSMHASDSDFDKWLSEKYTKLWRSVQAYTPTIETLFNSMAFGSTMSHFVNLATTVNSWDNMSMLSAMPATVFGGAGCILQVVQYLYERKNIPNDDLNINYSHSGAIASSLTISIFTITNYIYSVLTNLRRNKNVLSESEHTFIYTWIALFSALALYYYTRMYYERGIIKKRKNGEDVSSCFQRLERAFNIAMQHCNPTLASALLHLQNAFSKVAISALTTATLYGMWSSWRNAAVMAGVVDDSDLTMYPKTLFDIVILLSLGLGNFVVRFARINFIINQDLLSPVATPAEKLPLNSKSMNGQKNLESIV